MLVSSISFMFELVFMLLYYYILHILLLYYILFYLILYSSFFCSPLLSLLSSSDLISPSPIPFYTIPPSSPSPLFLPNLSHPFYTCRYLHTLIYVQSIYPFPLPIFLLDPQISDPACFIGVDG